MKDLKRWNLIYKFLYYSNALAIWKKFFPMTSCYGEKELPTGFIWIVGTWLAFYGFEYQLYESSKSNLDNRASIVSSLGIINEVGATQHQRQVKKPDWYCPFKSFLTETNDNVILNLKYLVKNNKKELDSTNLANSILDGIDLSGASMANAKVNQSSLRFCNFNKSNCRWVNFKLADVTGATFFDCDLRGAKFDWSKINLGQMKGSHLEADTLINVTAKNLNFERIRFTDVEFSNSNFSGSNFSNCQFENTWFKNSNLTGAIFSGVNLGGIYFQNTSVSSIDFTYALWYGDSLKFPGWTIDENHRMKRK